jgi:type II secretory pathway predicted ATPase ExeA
MQDAHANPRHSPLCGSHAPSFYESPTHEEALARLHFLVEHHRRLGLLLGDSGSGKSLLLQVFAGQVRRQGCAVAAVNLIGCEPRELLWSLAAQLGANPADDEPLFALWRKVVDRLSENRFQQLTTVVLLDDADHATSEVLTHIVRLLHAGPSAESPLTLIVAAQRRRLAQLGPRLLDLAELRIELDAWNEADTAAFLNGEPSSSRNQSTAFDPPATARLHQLGQGIPRRVGQLAELAQLAVANSKLPHIDVHTVDSVFEELSPLAIAVR